MATTVGEIAIQVGADITPLVAGLNRGRGEVSKFGSAVDSTASGSMKRFSLAGTLMAGAAVAAGLGIATLTKRAIENAGALHDASLATGVHVSTLQAMQQVAGEAGVETEALTASLKRMQNSIAGLIDGTKAQTEAFGKLGLGIGDLQGLNADEQFALIAEAIDGIADPTERTAAAMDIFGKTGANLIPMMEDYRNVLAEVAQHQRETGQAISDTDAAKLDDLGDSFSRLKDNAAGAAMQIAVAFGPAMLAAVDALATSMLGLNAMFADFKAFLETTPEETNLAAVAITMDQIAEASDAAADMAEKAAVAYQGLADGSISNSLRLQADSLNKSKEALRLGAISADEYKVQVNAALTKIAALLETVGKVNESDMSGAVSAMEDYAASIGKALGWLIELHKTQIAVSASASSAAGGLVLTPDGMPAGPAGVSPGSSPTATVVIGGSGGGHGGGGGGGSSAADDLKALQDRLATQAEIEQQAFEDAQVVLEEALAKKLLTNEQYQSDLERLQQDHADRMAQIDAATYGDGAQKMGAYFGVLADTFQSGNERLQKIGRVFGAAEALVNAWRAYSQTLADPTLPFFAKFAAAASVLSAGLGAVNAIRSGGGSGGGGSTTPVAGGGSSPSAPTQQSIANVTLVGDTFSGNSLEALVKQLNDAWKQGYILNVMRAP